MQYKQNLLKENKKELLEELTDRYNNSNFIESDPISIPHKFELKEDIEIAGFLTAILSWGQRKQIISQAEKLMQLLDYAPFDFVKNFVKSDIKRINKFYYRTFQGADLVFFIRVLKHIYCHAGGLEHVFTKAYNETKLLSSALVDLFYLFDVIPHEKRSMKHIACIQKGSSAKRLNMFLRWMVRKDNKGVDFGLWNDIPASALYIPLDVHSGRTAREFEILSRASNDWKAVLELTKNLREFDPVDPVKYDFALFGFSNDKNI
ncbi:MAG: TIGR02757 family protein [Bacteroidales bacterium]|nr:TIGR02757 family protein [Bacteroidales bacterium]MBN2817494.1 TIGR02757 family protein [Bacteroidales bacterium]